MHTTIGEVAAVVGGRVVGAPETSIAGVAIDSRTLTSGQLFVPVVAERDGHAFIATAIDAGAAAYLSSAGVVDERVPSILVENTVAALTRWATAARASMSARVIGITGSVGKTSTKDLTAAMLRNRFVVGAPVGSLNNELGVPLTVLAAPEGAEALVIEMGARTRGHIEWLCAIARPSIGVVTRVAAAHLGIFGSLDEIAISKSELVRALPSDGVAVLNGDDERVRAMAAVTSARPLFYSLVSDDADVVATGITLDEELRPSFELRTPWGNAPVRLHVHGRHNVGNALAAAAAALSAGATLDDVVSGATTAHLSHWRMELRRTTAGALLLNDAYNANPESMTAALHSLATLPARRRVAVLGYMAELGESAAESHRSMAELAQSLGIEVIAVGTDAYSGVTPVESVEDVPAVLGELGPGDAVLVKGSRSTGLERVVDQIASTPLD